LHEMPAASPGGILQQGCPWLGIFLPQLLSKRIQPRDHFFA